MQCAVATVLDGWCGRSTSPSLLTTRIGHEDGARRKHDVGSDARTMT